MSNNLNSIYHKGKFRDGEWSKHLRPFGKRTGNKRFRKTGKNIEDEITDQLVKWTKKNRTKKLIKVKMTYKFYGDKTLTRVRRFRTLRDAENSMRRSNVIKSEIIN